MTSLILYNFSFFYKIAIKRDPCCKITQMEIPGCRLRLLRKKTHFLTPHLCHVTHTLLSMHVPPSSTSPLSHYSSRVQSPSTPPPFLFFRDSPRAILLSRFATRQFGYLRDLSSQTLINIIYFATPARTFLFISISRFLSSPFSLLLSRSLVRLCTVQLQLVKA